VGSSAEGKGATICSRAEQAPVVVCEVEADVGWVEVSRGRQWLVCASGVVCDCGWARGEGVRTRFAVDLNRVSVGVEVSVQFCADRGRLCGDVEVEQAFFMHDGA
jgi:hypothetical protein